MKLFLAFVLVCVSLLGCGGSGGVLEVGVSLNPQAPSVVKNGTIQFTASVQGVSNHDVTWHILTIDGGSISVNGLYTAPPTAGVVTVQAKSVAEPLLTATTVVTVVEAG